MLRKLGVGMVQQTRSLRSLGHNPEQPVPSPNSMWVLLLLWPLALGVSQESGTQGPSIYDEDGSTERGDGK